MLKSEVVFNLLSANPTKSSNTLKRFLGKSDGDGSDGIDQKVPI